MAGIARPPLGLPRGYLPFLALLLGQPQEDVMKIIILAAALCVPSLARAQDAAPAAADTNFPALKDYPASTCAKPAPLPKKPITTSNAEIERYNGLIANYNKLGKAYVACVNAYVANANRDMDIIRQKSHAATDEANR